MTHDPSTYGPLCYACSIYTSTQVQVAKMRSKKLGFTISTKGLKSSESTTTVDYVELIPTRIVAVVMLIEACTYKLANCPCICRAVQTIVECYN